MYTQKERIVRSFKSVKKELIDIKDQVERLREGVKELSKELGSAAVAKKPVAKKPVAKKKVVRKR